LLCSVEKEQNKILPDAGLQKRHALKFYPMPVCKNAML